MNQAHQLLFVRVVSDNGYLGFNLQLNVVEINVQTVDNEIQLMSTTECISNGIHLQVNKTR